MERPLAADRPQPFPVAHDDRVSFPLIEQASPPATAAEKSQWTGAKVCGECHEANWQSSQATSHYKTSRFPTREALLGDYDIGENRMTTGDAALYFEMFRHDGTFYQRVIQDGREAHRAAVDLILGSGKMAQTYGTWVKDALFELPVTYYTPASSWVYSPGYIDGRAYFARPINSACLSCHTTGFVPVHASEKNYRYKSHHILPGVTCERCHGKGGDHVAHHRAHPDEKTARFILDPRGLSGKERDSLCSQCHGGTSAEDGGSTALGAHSNNQLQRLEKSLCFTKSDGLSCTDCHNPHRNERGNHQLFARRCQKCHEVDDCTAVTPERRAHFTDHCAECHMPRQPMVDIERRTRTGEVLNGFLTRSGLAIPEIIDHYIRVVRTNESAAVSAPLKL